MESKRLNKARWSGFLALPASRNNAAISNYIFQGIQVPWVSQQCEGACSGRRDVEFVREHRPLAFTRSAWLLDLLRLFSKQAFEIQIVAFGLHLYAFADLL